MNGRLNRLVEEYADLKAQEKDIATKVEECKKRLKSAVRTMGTPTSDDGYVYNGEEHSVSISVSRRAKLHPNAVDILRRILSPEDFKYLVETVEVVRTDRLEVVGEKLSRGESKVRGLTLRQFKGLFEVTKSEVFKISKRHDDVGD